MLSYCAISPTVACHAAGAACSGLGWCLILLAAGPCCMTRAVAHSVDASRTHTHTGAEGALSHIGRTHVEETRRPLESLPTSAGEEGHDTGEVLL